MPAFAVHAVAAIQANTVTFAPSAIRVAALFIGLHPAAGTTMSKNVKRINNRSIVETHGRGIRRVGSRAGYFKLERFVITRDLPDNDRDNGFSGRRIANEPLLVLRLLCALYYYFCFIGTRPLMKC